MTTTDETKARRFLSPFEVPTPEGAEGWQSMYPPYLLFSEENRDWEESSFWFLDSLHRPEIEYPFDTIVHEAWSISLGAFVSRVFQIPATSGIVHRVLNGRLYLSVAEITDPKQIEERVPTFMRRAGFYYERWGELFASWKEKMEGVIDELRALEVPELPAVEPEEVVTDHTGISSGSRLLRAYSDAVDNVFRAYQYHFEMHLCGYGAWLNLFQFCQQAFPGIPEQTVANMAAGTDILMFRPDDELKSLAQRAHDLGVAEKIRAGGANEVLPQLREDGAGGREWADAFEAAKYPWFYFSKGTGLYHHERSWVDDLSLPWGLLQEYVERIGRGEGLERPRQGILDRREQLTAEYRALLPSDTDREAFDQTVQLARTVAAYVEDHNFYIENWHHTVFWNKMREFSQRCVDAGQLEDVEDLFYLNRWEVGQILHDTVSAWAMSVRGRPQHWRSLVAQRKKTLEALRAWTPEPALGPVPGDIQEPFTLMLWGITTERVQQWLASEDGGNELRGVAGSPGVVEGTARVIRSVDELGSVQDGEVLVCPITAPTWGPVFGKIAAAVSDQGGIMSHAAIVSREYGLPAVVGTARGTSLLKTGMRVRVDGDQGIVTVLS